jgi:hypothetical protein
MIQSPILVIILILVTNFVWSCLFVILLNVSTQNHQIKMKNPAPKIKSYPLDFYKICIDQR